MTSRFDNKGFTLVEMLVALTLFTMVATVTVGALLVLVGGNSRAVDNQTALTALSFALDSMTREIRTGSEYYCGSMAQVTGSSVTSSSTAVRNCTTAGVGLSFREAGSSLTDGQDQGRIAYYYDGANRTIYRQIGDSTPESIVSRDIKITEAKFFVSGATKLTTFNTDKSQASVTLQLTAQASSSDLTKTFTLQTTIVQRALDI